jgi:putative chitinase
MTGRVAGLYDLFNHFSPNPAVAAAVLVLGTGLPPLAALRLVPALAAVAPHLQANEHTAWAEVLGPPLLRAGITTSRGIAAFLGQCAAESAGFHELEEDLRYSASRLCQVWPNHFPTPEAAGTCAMRPEVLANRVYADRMGNGSEASGDGWRFRGRGLLQLTGRAMYDGFAQAMGMTLDQAVAYAATPAGAADSAVWFWTANQLNTLANSWSIDLLTRKINGGTDGAAERKRLSEAALQAIGA